MFVKLFFHKFILTLALILTGSLALAQNYESPYGGRIKIFNTAGQNPNDFEFSNDVINGVHSCINNFLVYNNFNSPTSFNFQIYVNNILVYTGSVTVAPMSAVNFNDAFVNCYSRTGVVRVTII
ncbi:hypothetical protein [Flavobacterium kingsejongi]|uniref:Uncharacterized protein n=1 Tax=Flavobacterium kingsejongi TaxID=1678728 RepID=A0A2S1LTF6_9FLAO|nr:hypothetical protein [Flavobacterium kingsejongi]AWG26941.1 hypothetical protein FK004_17730 [Flavobacterium kingsejongi]